MNAIQAITGIVLLALALIDVFSTTLVVSGRGPVTLLLSRGIAHTFLAVHRRRHAHRLLQIAGPTVMIAVALTWFGLLWLGWTLVFAAGEQSVVHSSSNAPADASELAYFTGFTVITLGVGDYVPNGNLWEVFTVIASASGLFLFTLLVTYQVSVIGAVVTKRQVASQIHCLGGSPREILELAWTGKDYSGLNSHFTTLSQQIYSLEKQHLAYPLLHHFHTASHRSALAPAVADLDDALSLLLNVVPESQRPSAGVLLPLRRAISGLLGTLDQTFVRRDDEAPPLPEPPEGLPVSTSELREAFHQHDDRRRLLLAWVHNDGWTWHKRNETRLHEDSIWR